MKHTDYTITQMQLALVASLHEHRHTDSQANLLSQLCTHFHDLHYLGRCRAFVDVTTLTLASLSVHMHMHKTCMAYP